MGRTDDGPMAAVVAVNRPIISVHAPKHTCLHIHSIHTHTYYPDEDHVLVFVNASTNQKRPDGALSACRMPNQTSKWRKFGV
jgi:hypothetical protein